MKLPNLQTIDVNKYACYVGNNPDAKAAFRRERYFDGDEHQRHSPSPRPEISAASCVCVPATQHTITHRTRAWVEARGRKMVPGLD